MKFIHFGVFIALALGACQTVNHRPGHLEEEHYINDITVYNGGSMPISRVGVRPTGGIEWRFLTAPQIGSGESFILSAPPSDVCLRDYMIESLAGEQSEYIGIDACNVRRLVFPKEE